MEDVVGILMRHSEEGETSERRAGGQMKGLLLKVRSVGNALGTGEERGCSSDPALTSSPGEATSHPVTP